MPPFGFHDGREVSLNAVPMRVQSTRLSER